MHIFHFSGQFTQAAEIKAFLHSVPHITLGCIGSILSVPKDVEIQTSFIIFHL